MPPHRVTLPPFRLARSAALKSIPAVAALALAAASSAPAQPVDDEALQRLATCADSWLTWKDDPSRMAQWLGEFQSRFLPDAIGPAFRPKAATQVLGLPVVQVFPESVGMGVGFSLTVEAGFDRARQVLEAQLGTVLKCTQGDGMEACEAPLGEKRTAVLMVNDNTRTQTSLLGCYYFYGK
jgi:hypothetical protein